MVKHLPAMQETRVWSLGQENPLEKQMASHSSILAWRIPWTEEPVRLPSLGLQRVGHNWATNACTCTHTHTHTHTHRVCQVFYLFLGQFVISQGMHPFIYIITCTDIKLVIVPSYPFTVRTILSFFMMVVFVFSHFFLDQGKLWIYFFLMFYYKKVEFVHFFPIVCFLFH